MPWRPPLDRDRFLVRYLAGVSARAPRRCRQARPAPFGEAVAEPAGPEALPVQLAHRVVSVDAVGAAAVGDQLGVFGQGAQMLAQFRDGGGLGAGDVPRTVLRLGADVEDGYLAAADAGGELVSAYCFDAVAVTEIGPGEALDSRHV